MPSKSQVVDGKGPHTKPDKLRESLHGGLTNSETESNHTGWACYRTPAYAVPDGTAVGSDCLLPRSVTPNARVW